MNTHVREKAICRGDRLVALFCFARQMPRLHFPPQTQACGKGESPEGAEPEMSCKGFAGRLDYSAFVLFRVIWWPI